MYCIWFLFLYTTSQALRNNGSIQMHVTKVCIQPKAVTSMSVVKNLSSKVSYTPIAFSSEKYLLKCSSLPSLTNQAHRYLTGRPQLWCKITWGRKASFNPEKCNQACCEEKGHPWPWSNPILHLSWASCLTATHVETQIKVLSISPPPPYSHHLSNQFTFDRWQGFRPRNRPEWIGMNCVASFSTTWWASLGCFWTRHFLWLAPWQNFTGTGAQWHS